MRHSEKRRFPAIFLRQLSGSAAAPPAPIAPHHGRAKAGGLRAAQGHTAGSPPGQARFSPRGPDRLPRPPQPLEGRSPRTARLGPGIPPAPPVTAGVPLPRRPRSPPAQSRPGCALTAAGTRCLRPPARGRPMSERGCREDATRPWLLGRNSAAFLLPCFPPSSRASAPRGGGDCHGPIRAAGLARAAGRVWLCCWPPGPVGRGGARSGGGHRLTLATRRRAASELGGPWCQGKGDAGNLGPTPPAGPGERSRRALGYLACPASLLGLLPRRAWLFFSGRGDLLP